MIWLKRILFCWDFSVKKRMISMRKLKSLEEYPCKEAPSPISHLSLSIEPASIGKPGSEDENH
ncbi:hypothetical protein RYX36_030300 [Vicia faba]